MFFMMGIMPGQKDFDYNQMITCPVCGAYGSYKAFMTYTVLSLFFIPCLKWGKRYYVRTTCCNTIYELDPEAGRKIARGEDVTICPEDLTPVTDRGYTVKRCQNCGFTTDEDYEFCPKCGNRLY